TDLPAWLPPGEDYDTLHQGNVGKALAAGLRCPDAGTRRSRRTRKARTAAAGTPAALTAKAVDMAEVNASRAAPASAVSPVRPANAVRIADHCTHKR
ncbi:hypothetical protein AB0H37_15655, partial [Actinomadura sp. NPDC023710]|uniref:hypothetical protein n=1 Tax=Actinomadura sp. NPDC023710 TaxID=3158219 RepID=UPI0033FBE98E